MDAVFLGFLALILIGLFTVVDRWYWMNRPPVYAFRGR